MDEKIENPLFAEMRAAGAPWWEISAQGGCPACWGKGKWLGFTDADWRAAGGRAKRTPMSCGYCRGTGLDPHRKHVGGKDRRKATTPPSAPDPQVSQPFREGE